MNIDTYILDDQGNAVPEPKMERFYAWLAHPEKRMIGCDDLPDDVRISTVFLGIDHNHSGRGPPVLWETMIFGGPHDGYQRRYTSRGAAFEGHNVAVALAKGEVS
jgi:hypothetical protein